MSCAIFTVLGAYVLYADKSNKWALWATAAMAIFCLLVGCYLAWADEHKKVDEREAEIQRISKPDNCPRLLVIGWSEQHGQCPNVPDARGFWIQSEGESAYEITLEEFEIQPTVMAVGKMIPQLIGHQIGQAFMPVWIKNDSVLTKWFLDSAFLRASENKPSLSVSFCLLYRDHKNLWYRTTQGVTFTNGVFEFGPPNLEKLGLAKPHEAT